jgi:hypothetical protein
VVVHGYHVVCHAAVNLKGIAVYSFIAARSTAGEASGSSARKASGAPPGKPPGAPRKASGSTSGSTSRESHQEHRLGNHRGSHRQGSLHLGSLRHPQFAPHEPHEDALAYG